jgi:mycothiol synthase
VKNGIYSVLGTAAGQDLRWFPCPTKGKRHPLAERFQENGEDKRLRLSFLSTKMNFPSSDSLMEVAAIDERLLPAMYMVWSIDRLPALPARVVPEGYVLRTCTGSDLNAVRTLIDTDGPIGDKEWEHFVDRILPSGAFLSIQAESGSPVGTASAMHNPRATRYYFPFGGQVGYVAVDAAHRGKGLGRALVAQVVARLMEAGYRHIFVGVQGWRLPAVKCYLSLGFVPLVHDAALLPRWRRICEQIGWAVREEDWPRSLTYAAASRP